MNDSRDSADMESLVGRAAGEFSERWHRGDRPDVDEFAAHYSEKVADVLKQLLPALQGLGEDAQAVSDVPANIPADLPAELGDFRLLREVGRGGMGIVFEAEQISLNRRVALKLLPCMAALDEQRRKRFHNEALAAAHLQHAHIVPIFAVGYAGGWHYYAMQFIEGHDLGQVIGEMRDSTAAKAPRSSPRPKEACEALAATLPPFSSRDYFRAVARLGTQAADALEHAHQAGVLHRDIKPGNMLVDRDGKLWLTDFGVARLQDEARLTATGELIGTLHYMSPEQAGGSPACVDPRSDVYALGATLYELTTLEPMFREETRAALLRQIVQDEPVPPRRLNKTLPRELETIILKAIAKNPAERYHTADALAADLRFYLDDKPIQARRPTLGQRALRFLRRRKSLAAAVVIFLLLGLVGLGIAHVLLMRANQEVREESQRASDALTREAAQRRRAEHNLALGLRALDQVHLRLARKQLLRDPRLKHDAESILRSVVEFYEALVEGNCGEPAAGEEHGKALTRVGDIYAALGDTARAEQSYLRARALLGTLRAEFPDRPGLANCWAMACESLGALYARTSRAAQADQAFAEAREVLDKLHAQYPHNTTYHLNLTLVQVWQADRHYADRRLREAETEYRAALRLEDRLAGDVPRAASYRSVLATTLSQFGKLLMHSGRHVEAKERLLQARDHLQKLLADAPGDPEHVSELAGVHFLLGIIAAHGARYEEAEKSYRRACEFYESLADEFATVPDYRARLANVLQGLANVYESTQQSARMLQATKDSLGHQEKLVSDFPLRTDYRRGLATSLNNWGYRQRRLGQPGEGLETLRRALQMSAQLADDNPEDAQFAEDLVFVCNNLGMELFRERQLVEAQKVLGKALDRETSLVARTHNGRPRRELGVSLDTLGLVLAASGKHGEAISHLERALEIRRALAIAAPDILSHQADWAQTLFNLGLVHFDARQPRTARPLLAQALEKTRRLHEQHPRQPQLAQALEKNYALWIEVNLALADHAAVARAAGEMVQGMSDQPDTLFRAARQVARCMAHAEKDDALLAGMRVTVIHTYGDQVVHLLRAAVDNGFRDAPKLNDSAFDPVRQRQDFRVVLARLKSSQRER